MNRFLVLVLLTVLGFGLLSSGPCFAETPAARLIKSTLKNRNLKKTTITSKHINNSALTLSVYDQMNAGAISSLKLNDTELLSQFDKGRLIQSTVSFWGGVKGCYALNEAGAFTDVPNEEGSSILLSLAKSDHFIKTTTQMSYWLSGKDPVCKNLRTDNNRELLSKHTVERTVTLTPNEFTHLLLFNVTFNLDKEDLPPKDIPVKKEVTFEAVAGYLKPEFNQFYVLEPESGELLKEPLPVKGEQDKPVIISNEAGTMAMGVFSPDLPVNKKGYGRDSYLNLESASTSKWSCNFKLEKDFKPGKQSYQCYISVGTKEQVKKTLHFLYNTFKMTNISELSATEAGSGSKKNAKKNKKYKSEDSKEKSKVAGKKDKNDKETQTPQEEVVNEDLSYRKPATKIEIEPETDNTATPNYEGVDSDSMRILLKPTSK